MKQKKLSCDCKNPGFALIFCMVWDLAPSIQLKHTIKPEKDTKRGGGGKQSELQSTFVQIVVEQIKTLQPRKEMVNVHMIISEYGEM